MMDDRVPADGRDILNGRLSVIQDGRNNFQRKRIVIVGVIRGIYLTARLTFIKCSPELSPPGQRLFKLSMPPAGPPKTCL